MGASGAANTAAKRLAWAFFYLVGHKVSTHGGPRCPPALAPESQQPEDEPNAIDAPLPPLLANTETACAHDDYDGFNSGRHERINLARHIAMTQALRTMRNNVIVYSPFLSPPQQFVL